MPRRTKTVTLTKLDYDQFVYPAVAQIGPQGPGELSVGMETLHVLENREKAWREDVTEEVIREHAKRGEFFVRGFKQSAPEEEWTFTEEQAEYIAVSLQRFAQSGRMALAACRHASKLAERVLDAEVDALPAQAVE